jgi:DNA-directed RNA polymerase alpha subunit
MKELILTFPDEIEVDFENSDLAQGLIQLKLIGSIPIKIRDCDFSTRLYNNLKWYFDMDWNDFKNVPISVLCKISLSEFYKKRNVGKRSIDELVKFCSDKGITLRP